MRLIPAGYGSELPILSNLQVRATIIKPQSQHPALLSIAFLKMAHTEAASVYPPLEARPLKNTICLFDVDETLTPARGVRIALF